MARVSIGRPPKTCTVLAHIFPVRLQKSVQDLEFFDQDKMIFIVPAQTGYPAGENDNG